MISFSKFFPSCKLSNPRWRVLPKTKFVCWWMVGFKGQLSMKQYVPIKEVKPEIKFGNMQNLQIVTPVISKGTQAKKIVVWPNTDLATMLFGSPNSCFSKNITMFSVITFYIHPPCLWSPETKLSFVAQIHQIIVASQLVCQSEGFAKKGSQSSAVVEILWPLFGRIPNWYHFLARNQPQLAMW